MVLQVLLNHRWQPELKPELKPEPVPETRTRTIEPEPELNSRESKTQLQPPQYRKYSRRISLPFQTRQTGAAQLSVLLSK